MSRPISSFTLMLVAVACCVIPAGAGEEPTRGFDWPTSTPEAQGIDSEILVAALRRIRDDPIDVHALIIVRDGHVALECYVHPYDRDTLHNVKSVSKSVMSALVGIALRDGALAGVDQPVHELLPGLVTEGMDPRKKTITLRHLLTMTAGFDIDENGPLMREIFASDDWVRATFAQPLVADPGQRFAYSTAVSHVASAALTEAAGMGLLEQAERKLFGPLGIEGAQWTLGPKGYAFGGAELFMTPRDMVLFGLLYLDEGRWAGQQIVPREWVKTSTGNQLPDRAGDRRYGYWWWPAPGGDFNAMGWGGQAIAIDPSIDFVAVSTAADHGAAAKMLRGFEDLAPADEALPANPEAVAELRALVRELARPTPQPVPPLPEIAQRVSTRTYSLAPNARGLTTLTFHFDGGDEARLVLGTAGGAIEARVGLDGVYRVSDTGPLGNMPEGNRLALRGRWTEARTFSLESHEIGDPIHGTLDVTFEGDDLTATAAVRPIGVRMELRGKAPPAADPGPD